MPFKNYFPTDWSPKSRNGLRKAKSQAVGHRHIEPSPAIDLTGLQDYQGHDRGK